MLLVNKDVTDLEIEEALKFACLDKYIQSLKKGINTDIGEAGKLMSGGERQRLSIAMGILSKAKILLLDEVTSNLDVNTANTISYNFNELIKKGYTIISISHQKDFLKYADSIIEL